ncbi:hypothetical protein X768_23090 [Mesorhizobium sp. LSJC265A00]|nr:hypothetical protein X768_23090 [Mesorhizobium sp. LSJC265A00]
MNLSSAIGMMRILSSDGWKAKSKPASVLTAFYSGLLAQVRTV